ncbi:MAG: hypothetical protein GX591_11720 [Planctomycetes bacterium]|nr:hypothetical protein [Planctomycetota bacterium]
MGPTRRLAFDPGGAKALEWTIIIGLIVSGAVAAIAILGAWLCGPFASLRAPLGR